MANIKAQDTMLNGYIPMSPNSYVKKMYKDRAEIYKRYAVFASTSPVEGTVATKQEMYWAQVYNGDMTVQDVLDQLDKVQKSAIEECLAR